jgi:hypothetical protein
VNHFRGENYGLSTNFTGTVGQYINYNSLTAPSPFLPPYGYLPYIPFINGAALSTNKPSSFSHKEKSSKFMRVSQNRKRDKMTTTCSKAARGTAKRTAALKAARNSAPHPIQHTRRHLEEEDLTLERMKLARVLGVRPGLTDLHWAVWVLRPFGLSKSQIMCKLNGKHQVVPPSEWLDLKWLMCHWCTSGCHSGKVKLTINQHSKWVFFKIKKTLSESWAWDAKGCAFEYHGYSLSLL